MKPPPFAFRDPTTLGDALALLAGDEEASLIAGGQSLMPMLNFRLVRPSTVIDLNRIAVLAGISITNDGARIGSMSRQADTAANADLAEGWPLVRAALAHVAHPQIRNRGTIGGSLVHNDPAAELPAVMLALDAAMVVQNQHQTRRIDAADFSISALTTALETGDILTAIELPQLPKGSRHGFAEISRRHGDFALAAAAVVLSRAGEHARIVITGMGNGPQRITAAEQAVIAGEFRADVVAEVSALVGDAVSPNEDMHAPAWYRRKVAGVMAARACAQAISGFDGATA